MACLGLQWTRIWTVAGPEDLADQTYRFSKFLNYELLGIEFDFESHPVAEKAALTHVTPREIERERESQGGEGGS